MKTVSEMAAALVEAFCWLRDTGHLDNYIEHLRRSPHPDWRKRTCATCGYWAPKGEYEMTHCRKYLNARTKDPACPDWQPREEPSDD